MGDFRHHTEVQRHQGGVSQAVVELVCLGLLAQRGVFGCNTNMTSLRTVISLFSAEGHGALPQVDCRLQLRPLQRSLPGWRTPFAALICPFLGALMKLLIKRSKSTGKGGQNVSKK